MGIMYHITYMIYKIPFYFLGVCYFLQIVWLIASSYILWYMLAQTMILTIVTNNAIYC